MSHATAPALPHAGAHEEHHEDLGFLRKYVFSTDHKVIGIQYGITALIFLFFGFTLMMMMRWSIANPNKPIPLAGPLVGKMLREVASKGVMNADLDNFFGPLDG